MEVQMQRIGIQILERRQSVEMIRLEMRFAIQYERILLCELEFPVHRDLFFLRIRREIFPFPNWIQQSPIYFNIDFFDFSSTELSEVLGRKRTVLDSLVRILSTARNARVASS